MYFAIYLNNYKHTFLFDAWLHCPTPSTWLLKHSQQVLDVDICFHLDKQLGHLEKPIGDSVKQTWQLRQGNAEDGNHTPIWALGTGSCDVLGSGRCRRCWKKLKRHQHLSTPRLHNLDFALTSVISRHVPRTAGGNDLRASLQQYTIKGFGFML